MRKAMPAGTPRRRIATLAAIRGVMGTVTACASVLSGCAVYHPRPLPTAPDLARAPALAEHAGDLGVPGLKPEPIDPGRGLTLINVVTLAVVDNPRLKAVRQQAGVADAQLLAAGLLPDPQLSGGLSRSSLFTGYDANLAQQIQTLVTLGAARHAARAHQRAVNLDILWQEWQVAERARELYIQSRALTQLRPVLAERRRLLATLHAREQAALRQHFTTLGAVTADFIAWNSAESQWRALELEENETRHSLDELLGLAPDVDLRLGGAGAGQPIMAAQYRAALAALPRHRPDLLALQAGYHSQEEQVREAILAQFPLISAGVEQAKDPAENIQYLGFNVTLTLPLFNRNRGAIAIARASRAYLHQAYQASLDETTGQADHVWQAVLIMRQQRRTLDARLEMLQEDADAARESLARGTLTLAGYTDLAASALAVRAEDIRLHALLDQAEAALAMLLALPF